MSDYINYINTNLKPSDNSKYKAVDLFAGCGGLALGFEANGVKTLGFEMVSDFCQTYRNNLGSSCEEVKLTTETELPGADIVIGGPPCQPFSVGGKQLGINDPRNGFYIYIEAIKKIKPKLFVFENVRGLLYKNKSYLDEILTELKKLGYKIDIELFNFSNYGVPQNRERLIVVGHNGTFKFPKQQQKKVTVGEAIGDIIYQEGTDWKFLTKSMDQYIANYEKASKCINPRDLYLDRPSRTLTCRNLAGATGDMHRVKLLDGRRRRITVREAARLQSFPDWFEFYGKETSQFTQIGNAVPPLFAYQLGQAVREYLDNFEQAPKTKKHAQNINVSFQQTLPTL